MSAESSEGSAMAEKSGFEDKAEDAGEEVNCPVCGDKIRGNNYMVNSHIGMFFIWHYFQILIRRGKKSVLAFQVFVSIIYNLEAGMVVVLVVIGFFFFFLFFLE